MSRQVDVRASLAYRKQLKQISDDLTSGEVDNLKFLTAERIPLGTRERINSAQKLFDALENLGLLKIDNMDYVIRLLQQIGRKDIITKHKLQLSGKESLENEPEDQVDHSFKSLLLVLGQQIPSADLESLKGLVVDSIPRGRLQHVTNSFAFFGELESVGLLSDKNLDFLIELLDVIGRVDLVRVVTTFKTTNKVTKPSGRARHMNTLGGRSPVATSSLQQPSVTGQGHLAYQVSNSEITVAQQATDNDHGDFYASSLNPNILSRAPEGGQKEKIGAHVPTPDMDPSHGNQSTMPDRGGIRILTPYTYAETPFPEELHRAQDSSPGQISDYRLSLQMQKSNGRPSAPPEPIDDQSQMRQRGMEEEMSILQQRLLEERRAAQQLENQKQQEIEEVRRRLDQEQRMREDMERRQGDAARLEADMSRLQQDLAAAHQATQQLANQKQQEVEAVQQRLNQELRRRQEIEAERQRSEEEVRHLRARQSTGANSVVDCYPMIKNPRGFAVIISIERFPNSRVNLSDRQGTESDVQHLKQSFEKLNFIVRIHRNLTGSQLVTTMRDYGARDHSSYDCFVCCMLSHGKKDFIYGSNSEPVGIEQLTSQVDGLSCPSLVKKPKLFFIQACRGTGEDRGIETDSGLDEHVQRDALEQIKIPLQADYLLGYASPPGNVSFRSTTHGSWYVSALCGTLDAYAHMGVSLSDMLILVNQRLAEATTSDGFKQIPSPISQLTKRVVFSPVAQ